MLMEQVLLITEDENVRLSFLSMPFLPKTWNILVCHNPLQAMELIKKTSYDLIVCDLELTGFSGIDILQMVKELHPQVLFVLIADSLNKQ